MPNVRDILAIVSSWSRRGLAHHIRYGSPRLLLAMAWNRICWSCSEDLTPLGQTSASSTFWCLAMPSILYRPAAVGRSACGTTANLAFWNFWRLPSKLLADSLHRNSLASRIGPLKNPLFSEASRRVLSTPSFKFFAFFSFKVIGSQNTAVVPVSKMHSGTQNQGKFTDFVTLTIKMTVDRKYRIA